MTDRSVIQVAFEIHIKNGGSKLNLETNAPSHPDIYVDGEAAIAFNDFCAGWEARAQADSQAPVAWRLRLTNREVLGAFWTMPPNQADLDYWEGKGVFEPLYAAPQPTIAPSVALQVWYGPMPESNGKTNWTAILHRGDVMDGITIDRSEYPDRVGYEADRMRWMIGEIAEEPDILAYDANKRSGYVAPSVAHRGGDAIIRGFIELVEKHADVREGYCCCGDAMENHGSPMDCGHSAVDAGEYHAGLLVEEAKKYLAAPESTEDVAAGEKS